MDSVRDDMGRACINTLSRFVDLINIDTPLKAAEYVYAALSEASELELARLRLAVIGPEYRPAFPRYADVVASIRPTEFNLGPPKAPRQLQRLPLEGQTAGGYHPFADHVDGTDPFASKFFELLDAIHDFADHPDEIDMRVKLRDSLGAIVPNGFDIAKLHDKDDVLQKLYKFDELHFKLPQGVVHKVKNPLKARCLEAGIGRYFRGNSVTMTESSQSPDLHTVDLYFKVSGDKRRFATIEDIVELRRSMHAFYAMQPRSVALKAADVLDVMIDKDMTTDHDRAQCHLVAWMTGFDLLLTKVKKYFVLPDDTKDAFIEKLAETRDDKATISFWFCDASIHDAAATTGFEFSSACTGNVFHRDSMVQFEFKKPRAPALYGYKVTTADRSLNPIDGKKTSIDSLNVRVETRKEVVLDSDDKTVLDYRVRQRYDKPAMKTEIDFINDLNIDSMNMRVEEDQEVLLDSDDETELDYDERQIYDTSAMKNTIKFMNKRNGNWGFAVPAALKRAADWGQIEHCKRNRMLFISADRMGTHYAAYRDAPVMLVKTRDFIGQDDTSTHVQYSFCMCASKHARSKMRKSSAQAAGGEIRAGTYAAWAALAAIVVVASLS